MALHVFLCQAEDGGQKGNSAASDITGVNLDFILHGGQLVGGGETYARKQGVNLCRSQPIWG